MITVNFHRYCKSLKGVLLFWGKNPGYFVDARGETRTPSASYDKNDWLKSRKNKNWLSVSQWFLIDKMSSDMIG